MQRLKYFLFGIGCFLLGTAALQPTIAHVITGKDAHTLSGRHYSYFAAKSWVQRYYVTKSSISNYYLSKTAADSVYLKKSEDDINDAIYLPKTEAASTYLTQAAAASHITQTDADNRYLQLTGGTLAGDLTVNGNLSAAATSNGNIYANSYNYPSPGKTRYLNIPGAAFKGNDTVVGSVSSNSAGDVYAVSGSGYASAPIYLPDDAIITAVKIYYKDNTGAGDLTLNIRKQSSNSYVNVINPWSSSGSPNVASYTESGTDLVEPVVDTVSDSYYAILQFGTNSSSLTVYNIRITYTVTNLD